MATPSRDRLIFGVLAALVLALSYWLAGASLLGPHDPRVNQSCGRFAHWQEEGGGLRPRRLACVKVREPEF